MGVWLYLLIGILALAVVALLVKIHMLKKAASEIENAFADKLITDTNTLIDISCNDKHMRKLANAVNIELRNLRAKRHRFEQGDTALKNAITNISHDLRTPLTAISGYLDLLKQEEKPDVVSGYLDIIENRADVLKQLSAELFQYSVVMSKSEDMVFETVVLNNALEECISGYYAALKKGGITPEISIPEQPVERKLNYRALSHVLENVIGNAIKYSEGDLSISLHKNGEIIFSNRAKGINAVTVGKLFDRFFTVETGSQSTGLGLSIAKQLTQQMNGTIAAQYLSGRLVITIKF